MYKLLLIQGMDIYEGIVKVHDHIHKDVGNMSQVLPNYHELLLEKKKKLNY